MRKTLLLVVCMLLISGAHSKAGGDSNDQKNIQGVWNPKTVIENGRENKPQGIQMVFKGKNFTIRKDKEVLIEGSFVLDASKRPPHINLTIAKSPNQKDVGKVAQGIYELNGTKLRWCSTKPGANSRPDTFSSEIDSQRMLVTFEIVKNEQ